MYDLAKGRPSSIYRPRDLAQPVDTPFRARRAAGTGAAAGWSLCVAHVISALFVIQGVPRYYVVVGHNPVAVTAIHLLMALIAAGLAVLMQSRPTVRTASILLAWSGVEAVPLLTLHMYAHAAWRGFAGLMIVFAVIGLRGALALRKLPQQSEPSIPA